MEEEVKAKGEEYVLVTSKITNLDLQIEGKQDDIRTMLHTQKVELEKMTNRKLKPGEEEGELVETRTRSNSMEIKIKRPTEEEGELRDPRRRSNSLEVKMKETRIRSKSGRIKSSTNDQMDFVP